MAIIKIDVSEAIQSIKTLNDEVNKFKENIGNANKVNINSFNKLEAGINGITENTKNLRLEELKLQKKREEAFDKYERKLKKEKALREKQVLKESQLRQRLLAQRKREEAQTKRATEANNRLNRAYIKLNNSRTEAANLLRDLIASEKASNKEIKEATANFKKLDAKVRKADDAVRDHTKNVGNYKSAFGGLKKMVVGVVGAFGLMEGGRMLYNFAKDSVKIAREAKGIEFAFKNIGVTGSKAFIDVKMASAGLLSDMDIKKNIILFDNFNISLSNMGDLMEFAAVRSAQTGESMEMLANSIATGLGRESVLILDNLGINTKELRDLMDELGISMTEAFSILAKREVAEAGDILKEHANATELFSAALENLSVNLGKSIDEGGLSVLTKGTSDFINVFNDAATVSDSFMGYLKELTSVMLPGGVAMLRAKAAAKEMGQAFLETADDVTVLTEAMSKYNKSFVESGGLSTITDSYGKKIADLKNKITNLNDEINDLHYLDTIGIKNKRKQIKLIQDEIDKLEGLEKVIKKVKRARVESVNVLVSSHEELEKQQKYLKSLYDVLVDMFNIKDIELNVDVSGLEDYKTDIPSTEGTPDEQNIEYYQYALAAMYEIENLSNAIFERKIQRIEEEIAMETEKYDKLLNLARDDEQERAIIERNKAKTIEELEKKKRKEQVKQAKFNKAMAISQIAINTSIAVTGALGKLPWTYDNIVQGALMAALGAIELSAAIAQPIPTFAEGGIMNKDGVALINDGGNQEYVERGGQILTTTGINTLVPLKSGDIIHKDYATLQKQSILASILGNGSDIEKEDFDKLFNGVGSAVENGLSKAKLSPKITVLNTYNPYKEQMQTWN